MLRTLLSVIFVVVLAVSCSSSSDAQPSCPAPGDRKVSLSGIVSDPTGALLRDAHVTLSCGEISVSVITDSTGQYSAQLPAGTYKLSVGANGFTTKEQNLQVLPDRRTNRTWSLISLNKTVRLRFVRGLRATS